MELNPQLRNVLMYALNALIGAFIAAGLILATQLAGTDDIAWRAIAAAFASSFFGALSTAYISATRPRIGSENLAKDVNELRALGVSRQDMTVTVKADSPLDHIHG